MGRSSWRGWLAGVVVVVAVAPAGCGFGGSGGADPPVASDGSSSGTVTTSTTPASGGFAEVVIAWYWTIEEETARCMAERGFEYVPYVPQVTIDNTRGMYGENQIEVRPDADEYFWAPLFPMEMSPVSEGMLEESLEEARRTGFSIFFEPELNTDVAAPPEDDLDANPNGAIVQALEGEEQAEYFRALQGYAAGDLDGANGPSEAAMENACGEVARRLAGPEPMPPARLEGIDIEQLHVMGDKVYRLTHADPRLDAAEADRVACLADRGLPTDPYEYILDLLYAERERITGDPHGAFEGQGTEDGMAKAFGADRLRELQAEELAAAVAGNECAIPYSRVEREVIRDYEQQVLAENPDIADLLGIDQ